MLSRGGLPKEQTLGEIEEEVEEDREWGLCNG